MAKPAFDPNQPFEEASEQPVGEKPAFDPNAEFQAVEQTSAPKTSELGAAGLGLAQGVTMDFADELAGAIAGSPTGAVKSALDMEEDEDTKRYKEMRDLVRSYEKSAQAESPNIYGGSKLVGGVGSALAGSAGLSSLGVAAKGLKGAAAVGAGMGAASGLGSTEKEGLPEQLKATTDSAVVGGALGAGGAMVGPVLGAAAGAGLGYATVNETDPTELKLAKVLGGGFLGKKVGQSNVAAGTTPDIVGTSKTVEMLQRVMRSKDPLYKSSDIQRVMGTETDVGARSISEKIASLDKDAADTMGRIIQEAEASGETVNVMDKFKSMRDKVSDMPTYTDEASRDKNALLKYLEEKIQGRSNADDILTRDFKLESLEPTKAKILEKDLDVKGTLADQLKTDQFRSVLRELNKATDEALYNLNQGTNLKEANNTLAAIRKYKEEVLGLKSSDLGPDQSTQIDRLSPAVAKFIRENRGGTSAAGLNRASELSAVESELTRRSPESANVVRDISKMVEPVAERYETAQFASGSIKTPLVGKAASTASFLGIPRVASAATHFTKYMNDMTADTVGAALQKLQLTTPANKIQKISNGLTRVAFEKDPARKNAMIFALSQDSDFRKALTDLGN